MITQEFIENGDEYKIINHVNTDFFEHENWKRFQENNGFIRENGRLVGRFVLDIPAADDALLTTTKNPDYLLFRATGDKNALKRLLKKFPYWRCASGGFL